MIAFGNDLYLKQQDSISPEVVYINQNQYPVSFNYCSEHWMFPIEEFTGAAIFDVNDEVPSMKKRGSKMATFHKTENILRTEITVCDRF